MSNKSGFSWKEFVVILITLASLGGLWVMFNAEGHVVLQPSATDPSQVVHDFYQSILPAIQKYSLAIGGILLAMGISHILLASKDDIATSANDTDLKK